MTSAELIVHAFYAANKERPYSLNQKLVNSAMPPGGHWEVVVKDNRRCVEWRGRDIFAQDPAGEIAMAARALPLMDGALRVILVLAKDAANVELIRELATSVIAYVEMPAPAVASARIYSDDGDDDGGDA